MNILLTNDDGIHYEGLWALHKALREKHAVTVVAPDRERSAISHALTLHEPLRVLNMAVNGSGPCWAVSGTPADCVKLAMIEILENKPDLVVSGINPGANVGVNVNYSGTVSAAREGALYGVPSIAASMEGCAREHYADAAGFIATLVDRIAPCGIPSGTFLNVNFPNLPLNEIAGVRICRQSTALYSEFVEKRIDPRDKVYYWQGFDAIPEVEGPDMDSTAVKEHYIAITPIKCDMTDYAAMELLKDWNREYESSNP